MLLLPAALLFLALPVGRVAAAASPSPSPALSTIVASPQESAYVDDTTDSIPLHGDFNRDDYAGFMQAAAPGSYSDTLARDGFVSGFARSWFDPSARHFLLELVIAFNGNAGASRWLAAAEAADKRSPHYIRAISVGGVGPYYAWHLADPASPDYADVVSFVKGNDFFFVGVDSPADDLGSSVVDQARRQFGAAPAYTIPPSRWPEDAAHRSLGYYLAVFAPNALALAVFVGLLAILTAVISRRLRSRRPPR